MITMLKKEYANAGIPFVSADGNIDSKNVVIYGHSSKWNNIIFTPLMSYVNQSYYKEYPTFQFITKTETRIYQIFAVLNVDLTTLIISKKPGNTGISRDIRTEFTTDLLLSD